MAARTLIVICPAGQNLIARCKLTEVIPASCQAAQCLIVNVRIGGMLIGIAKIAQVEHATSQTANSSSQVGLFLVWDDCQ